MRNSSPSRGHDHREGHRPNYHRGREPDPRREESRRRETSPPRLRREPQITPPQRAYDSYNREPARDRYDGASPTPPPLHAAAMDPSRLPALRPNNRLGIAGGGSSHRAVGPISMSAYTERYHDIPSNSMQIRANIKLSGAVDIINGQVFEAVAQAVALTDFGLQSHAPSPLGWLPPPPGPARPAVPPLPRQQRQWRTTRC